MLVRRYLSWIQSAPAEARAAGTGTLARAFVEGAMSHEEHVEAAAALTLALDDAEPSVRRAMAIGLADSPLAPRHLIRALAADRPDIAAIVVERSPVPTDGDLIDWVATREGPIQAAIARRHPLSSPVAAAIAEVGEPEAAVALLRNPFAAAPGFSLTRLAERFAHDAAVVEALLSRRDLPVIASYELTAGRYADAPSEAGRRDAHDRAAVAVSADLGTDELLQLAAHLRATGRLNVSLLLRCVVCGRASLFHAALAELSGLPVPRVAGIASERRGGGFLALCRRIGLPDAAVPVFRDALQAWRRAEAITDWLPQATAPLAQSRRVLAEVIEAGRLAGWHESDALWVSLRRLDDELARDEALSVAGALLQPAEGEPMLLLQPGMAVAPADEPAAPQQDNAPAATLALPDPLAFQGAVVSRDETEDAPLHGAVREDVEFVAPAPTGETPSFGAMARLLEDAVASALSNLPPPPARKPDWKDMARQALVIEGEWVGVAVGDGFDPDQFKANAA
ncbi:MAG: DUF2336 domain-containing protein [Alsobacter sp.]